MSGTPIVDDLSDGVERPKLADHRPTMPSRRAWTGGRHASPVQAARRSPERTSSVRRHAATNVR